MVLIDNERLTSSKINFQDKFQELLHTMAKNMRRREVELQAGVDNDNLDSILDALHSLIGVSGYLGAYALQQYIKLRLYPAVYAGQFPEEEGWVETVHALIAQSITALQNNWIEQTENI